MSKSKIIGNNLSVLLSTVNKEINDIKKLYNDSLYPNGRSGAANIDAVYVLTQIVSNPKSSILNDRVAQSSSIPNINIQQYLYQEILK